MSSNDAIEQLQLLIDSIVGTVEIPMSDPYHRIHNKSVLRCNDITVEDSRVLFMNGEATWYYCNPDAMLKILPSAMNVWMQSMQGRPPWPGCKEDVHLYFCTTGFIGEMAPHQFWHLIDKIIQEGFSCLQNTEFVPHSNTFRDLLSMVSILRPFDVAWKAWWGTGNLSGLLYACEVLGCLFSSEDAPYSVIDTRGVFESTVVSGTCLTHEQKDVRYHNIEFCENIENWANAIYLIQSGVARDELFFSRTEWTPEVVLSWNTSDIRFQVRHRLLCTRLRMNDTNFNCWQHAENAKM